MLLATTLTTRSPDSTTQQEIHSSTDHGITIFVFNVNNELVTFYCVLQHIYMIYVIYYFSSAWQLKCVYCTCNQLHCSK